MPKVSISEAARMVGKSRITLHRHIEKGRLSKDLDESGSPVIDVSELERVYGPLKSDTAPEAVSAVHHVTGGTGNDGRVLQAEIESLREKLATLAGERERERQTLREVIEDLREDRDRWRSQAERATLLISDQRKPEGEAARRGWWPWRRRSGGKPRGWIK